MQKNSSETLPRSDTIAAQATPQGIGALAIVRLSGSQALTIAANLIRDSKKLLDLPPRTLHLVDIVQADGSLLDQAVFAMYPQPHSYTGENVVELFLHGSPYISSKLLEHCYKLGARPAHPGEFTLRAFLNNRMDLAQAEAVADLIAASGESAHRAAILQREGNLSRRIHNLRDKLLESLSLIELNLDFSDQEVPLIEEAKLLTILVEISADLEKLKESFARGRLAREGAVIVIAGAPNVGKSTLFNALLGEDRVIVDEQPGTTRDTVEAHLVWEGLCLRLIDTAGQAEYTLRSDQLAVERAQKAVRSADLLLWLIDLTTEHSIYPDPELRDKVLIIGNKADLISRNAAQEPVDCPISALRGEGIANLKTTIIRRVFQDKPDSFSEGVLTRERHYDAVCQALEMLNNGQQALNDKLGHELIALDIRQAADYLGEIIGEVTSEEIINRIFSDFCIGK